jgi:hypothetical protein
MTAAAPSHVHMDHNMLHNRTLMLEKALNDARFEITQRTKQNENAMLAQVTLNDEIDRLTHENNQLVVCGWQRTCASPRHACRVFSMCGMLCRRS